MLDQVKIAIQDTTGTFSERWINYCKENNYNFILVDCYKSNIIEQLKGSSHFLWHFQHSGIRDLLFAKQLIYSIENMGIKTFPNFHTAWHFDDKIGQKYLLESIGAPLVSTYIFYDKSSALEWANSTSYPWVFKLRGGAGSSNVLLIKSKLQAKGLIKKAFSKGFNNKPSDYRMNENWVKFKKYKSINYFIESLAGLKNHILPSFQQKLNVIKEKGYIYVQEFLDDNSFDIRVIVIGNRAFAAKRLTRKNDFRASGSGMSLYSRKDIDICCIKIAFEVYKKLNSQSVAFDFIYDRKNEPKILEISYGFAIEFYDPCEGYWDEDLKWFSGRFIPQNWIIEDLLSLK